MTSPAANKHVQRLQAKMPFKLEHEADSLEGEARGRDGGAGYGQRARCILCRPIF